MNNRMYFRWRAWQKKRMRKKAAELKGEPVVSVKHNAEIIEIDFQEGIRIATRPDWL